MHHSRHKVVNALNQYFVNVGGKIDSTSSNTTAKEEYKIHLRDRNPTAMFLIPTTPDEVSKIVTSLKTDKSPGDDNITATLLKSAGPEMLIGLANIINLTFSTGTFPKKF